MQPRLSSSRKWTALPKEFMQQVQGVMKETFKDHIAGGKIQSEGRIYPEEILIRVSYSAKGVLKESGFDVSIAYKKDKDNVLKLLHVAVDAAGSLMDQFFTSENDHDFPRIWTEVDFEGRQIYIQYNTTNTELEAEADKLLGIAEGEDLAGGDWDEDDEVSPEQIKAALGIDDDDDLDEDASPKLGGGKKSRKDH